MSYEEINQTRKKSKVEQSLRASWSAYSYKSSRKCISKAIWNLTSPGLQILAGSSTYWEDSACWGANHSHYNQDPKRCCPQTKGLCTNQRFNDGRDCRACRFNFSDQRRLSWLIVPNKILRFVWSPFLIVIWEQNLSRVIIFLFQVRVVLWESHVH